MARDDTASAELARERDEERQQEDASATRLVEPLAETIQREGPDHWLWCLYCHRFFQARHIRVDYRGNRQGCGFCGAAGFNVALFSWETWKNADEPWPTSISELHHGMRLKIWTVRRYIALEDDGAACQVLIDPEDRWVYELTFDPDSGRMIADESGDHWGSRTNPILLPLTHAERRAARRGQWRRIERRGQQLAHAPLRFRHRWQRRPEALGSRKGGYPSVHVKGDLLICTYTLDVQCQIGQDLGKARKGRP